MEPATNPATAHIGAIGTATPGHDIHRAFVEWARARLEDPRERSIFERMAARSGIEHRWSVLPRAREGGSPVEPGGFYHGELLPSTGRRMKFYAAAAPDLAIAAIENLARQVDIGTVTHLVVASCTGFVAPGIDQLIIERLRLRDAIERTLVGFMGCYAAVAALRVAHHIARSEPQARVLVVTVELSSLHLGPRRDLEALLAELQFGDGAAAAIVSSEPGALAIDRFFCANLPASRELIRWTIGDEGFEMTLSGEVPHRIAQGLRQPELRRVMLAGRTAQELAWAVHAGGRSILDAVETALELGPAQLLPSRTVLARYGNMSSATLMFVLAELMSRPANAEGIAIAFGPGLAAEGFSFRHSRFGDAAC
jgi:predicted naringenin-chalcone synthase